jgi:hypothetical protein
MASEFRLGDVGSVLQTTVTEDNVAVDLSSATSLVYDIVKPSGRRLTRNGTLIGDGTTGQLRYVFVAGELDESGRWTYQLSITMPTGRWTTSVTEFSVVQTL